MRLYAGPNFRPRQGPAGPSHLQRGLVSSAIRGSILLGAVALIVPASAIPATTADSAPVEYGYRIVNSYPHDPGAYTQGLLFHDGFLFESTGRNGHSSVRKVRLETGEVVQQQPVDSRYFAEGLTLWKGRLIQLTWQSHLAFVYDAQTFRFERSFRYSGEGWGLTSDGTHLVTSDGTATLRFLDPESFTERRRVVVKAGGLPVASLNELEFVRGEIYANVWHTDRIARIAPDSGRVVGWIDMTGLLSPAYRMDPEGVLNGIAFDPDRGRVFVTGKLWPKLFEIDVQRRRGRPN